MKKIGIVTTNRADFYLLSPFYRKLNSSKEFQVELIVTGGHLLSIFGETIKDINFPIDHIIQVVEDIESNESYSVNRFLNQIMVGANNLFSRNHFDYVILLGDRFELAGIALILFNLGIPILHLYGGEVTLGSKDNVYRYLISRMSRYHFVSNDKYKDNLINHGIASEDIFVIGYVSYDLVENVPYFGKKHLFNALNLTKYSYSRFALISLHPPTKEAVTVSQQISLIDLVLNKYGNILFISTSANNDYGGAQLNEWYLSHSNFISNFAYIPNLGFDQYINLIRQSAFVIGNSSSLMTEVPILNKPAILLGKRQDGRESLGNLNTSDYSMENVSKMIDKILLEPPMSSGFNQAFSTVEEFYAVIKSLLIGS